jgi:two-component system, NarL family, response regulator DegU
MNSLLQRGRGEIFMKIRIVIADDHAIVRSGIRGELMRHTDFEVVAEALNGDDTISFVKELKPDILLLDINMPGRKVIDVVQEIKNQTNGCRILVLSAHGDIPTIIGMLKAGVNGYILKDEDPEVLSEAIHSILLGDTWLSPGVSDRLTSIINNIDAISDGGTFTKREVEVLSKIASGNTNREIAGSLQMAERTVEFHIGNILRKIGAKSRLEAVLKAKEKGIII